MKNNSSKLLPSQDRQNALAKYFQDMAGRGLLSAQDEVEIARTLRLVEEELWQIAFSNARTVSEFASLLSEDLKSHASCSLSSLQGQATRHLRSPSSKTRNTLDRSAEKIAKALRTIDPDQELLKRLLCAIEDGAWKTEFEKKDKNTQAALARMTVLNKKSAHLRNRFVESNLGLVVSVARRYQFSGMNLADLIQEGNLGLLKAVSRFDERKGFRFSTYATWWIRHAVGRSVSDKSRTVRIPVHVMESNQKIKKIRKELALALERDPSLEEIATAAELSERKVESIISNATAHCVSLDAPIGTDGERERMEVFSTDSETSAFETLAFQSLSKRANLALNSLAPIEIEILHRRFGLAGKTATTLQEIANSIGKSRERIRQIQEKALVKIREHLQEEQAA